MGSAKVESFVHVVQTSWGQWSQSLDEVTIEINVTPGSSSREIKCIIKSDSIAVTVRNDSIIQGKLFAGIVGDDSFWTLEDKKLLRIVLHKREMDDQNVWKSLLDNNEYPVNAEEWENVEKKLSLERFQKDSDKMARPTL